MVAKSAVLWTGKKSVVYIKKDRGDTYAFFHREITLGEDAGTYYVVTEGLKGGEEVVTNGAFKIDAAAQLKGNQSMMNPEGGKQATHSHGGMAMGAKDEVDVNKATVEAYSQIDPQFKTQFSKVVEAYLMLKDDLVLSEKSKAVVDSETFKKSMNDVNMGLLKGDAHVAWMSIMNDINQAVDQIINSSTLGDQRNAFAILSIVVYNTLKTFEIHGLDIYYQYCPMVDDNKGAYWLSLDSEIRNPYFGDSMLTCGEIIETIN